MHLLEKLSKRERFLVTVMLVLAFLSVVHFGFIKNIYPKYRVVRENLEIKKQELSEMQTKVNEFDKMQVLNKDLKKKLINFTSSFNKEVRNGINYYYVGKHAVDCSVAITEIVPQPYQDRGQYLEIPLKIAVRGKYQDILRFFALVEEDMPNTSELKYLNIHPLAAGAFIVDSENESHEETDSRDQINQTDQESTFQTIITEKNPDIEGKITMVTYAVKTPEMIYLAEQKELGRYDAFSPTIDLPPVASVTNDDMDLYTADVNWPFASDDQEEDFYASEDTQEEDLVIEETDKSPVPAVTTTDTGSYSFPERDVDRDKEGQTP